MKSTQLKNPVSFEITSPAAVNLTHLAKLLKKAGIYHEVHGGKVIAFSNKTEIAKMVSAIGTKRVVARKNTSEDVNSMWTIKSKNTSALSDLRSNLVALTGVHPEKQQKDQLTVFVCCP